MSAALPTPQKFTVSDSRQGTLVSAKTKVANVSGIAEVVSITPDKIKAGDVLNLGGTNYPIITVTPSPLKTNTGSVLAQKSATIQLPENTTQPVKKFSFLIVKSF